MLITKMHVKKRMVLMDIKELRKEKSMTQKDLADAIGVSVSVVSRYESGQVKPPLDKMLAILDVFGIDDKAIEYYGNDQQDRQLARLMAYYNHSSAINNYYLKRIVVLGANGCCELCGKEAPFKDKEGRPYLEIRVLDDIDGNLEPTQNMVALCPNCSRKIEILNDANDLKKLREIANRHSY